MNTKYLHYLLAIESEGSINKAAAKLGISHTALSHYLNSYEESQRITLFDRDRNHCIPTEAGRIYLDSCKEIMEIQRITAQEIKNRIYGHSEQITMGITPQRGDQVILQIFSDFHSKFPDVWLKTYNCYPQEGKQLLREKRIDCLLGGFSMEDEKAFDICQVWKERIRLVLPSYLADIMLRKPENTSGDLRAYWDSVYVLYSPGTGARAAIDAAFKNAGFRPNIIYETNNPQVILQLIKKGVGIGFVPEYYTRKLDDDLKIIPLDKPIYSLQGILCRKNQTYSPAFRYLLSLLDRKTGAGEKLK